MEATERNIPTEDTACPYTSVKLIIANAINLLYSIKPP
jgi:hypothetical protein